MLEPEALKEVYKECEEHRCPTPLNYVLPYINEGGRTGGGRVVGLGFGLMRGLGRGLGEGPGDEEYG